jgi:hypothetical protein
MVETLRVTPSACPRCGQATGLSRWCGTCGQDLRPDLPPSDIPEARHAALLEQRWQERHGGGPAGPGPEALQREAPQPQAPSPGFLPPAGAGPTAFGPPLYVPAASGGGFRSPRSAAVGAAGALPAGA